MKLALRAVIAIAAGVVVGMLLIQPPLVDAVQIAARLAVRALRMFVFPLVFFGLITGARALGRDSTLRTHAWLIATQAAITMLLSSLGVLSVLVASPNRIPIITVDRVVASVPSFSAHLQQALPTNLFAGLTSNAALLLPVYLIALVIGLTIPDNRANRPLIDLIDAVAELFHRINSFVTSHIWVVLLLGGAALTTTLAANGIGPYRELLVVLAIDTSVVCFVLLPTGLILNRTRAPFRVLLALTVPALTALATGNHHASLAALTRHGADDLRVPRPLGSVVFPLYAMFGRAGSAMVAAAAFTVVIRSYSGMPLAAAEVLWIIGTATLLAFALSTVPGGSVAAALALIATRYGHGLEESYLIMDPALPLIAAIGVGIDVIVAGAIATAFGQRKRYQR